MWARMVEYYHFCQFSLHHLLIPGKSEQGGSLSLIEDCRVLQVAEVKCPSDIDVIPLSLLLSSSSSSSSSTSSSSSSPSSSPTWGFPPLQHFQKGCVRLLRGWRQRRTPWCWPSSWSWPSSWPWWQREGWQLWFWWSVWWGRSCDQDGANHDDDLDDDDCDLFLMCN